jgi:hypothetical protein
VRRPFSILLATLCAALTPLAFSGPASAQAAPDPAAEAKTEPDPKPEARPEPRPETHPDPKPAPAADDWVEIRLVTEAPGVALYAKESRKVTMGEEMGDGWAFACAAPCNERVDPRLTYRVMGEGIIPSIDFHLAPGAGRVSLRVRPARRNSTAPGDFVAVTGALGAFAGVLMFLLDIAEHTAANAEHAAANASGAASAGANAANAAQASLQANANTYGNIGVGLVAAGVVLGASAILLLRSGTTNLTPIASGSAAGTATIRLVPGGFAF